MISANQERWAEALAVEKMHGDRASQWIADRVTTLASAGDMAGVERMIAIATKLDQLRFGGAPD